MRARLPRASSSVYLQLQELQPNGVREATPEPGEQPTGATLNGHHPSLLISALAEIKSRDTGSLLNGQATAPGGADHRSGDGTLRHVFTAPCPPFHLPVLY